MTSEVKHANTKAKLPNFLSVTTTHLFDAALSDAAQDGVYISSYGRGQITGAIYTIPAHGEIQVHLRLRLSCVTPESVKALDQYIRSLLDASRHHDYDEIKTSGASGGLSLFGFFSFGGSASYSETKHTMSGWGLSEENQKKIVEEMMKLVSVPSEFEIEGTIYNRDHDYAVSGSLFGIVMDAEIQQSEQHKQLRFLAPDVQLVSGTGDAIPMVGKIYN